MKYVAAVLVALALWAGWRLLASRPDRVPPDFLNTYESLGTALVEQSGVPDGDILVLVAEHETNQPPHHELLAGLRRGIKRRTNDQGQVIEVSRAIDPMAAQNGTAALRWSEIKATWAVHPDARLLVLLLDALPPGASERPTADQAVVFRPPLGTDSRNLLKTGAIRLLVTPRTPTSPPVPEDAPLWQRSFDLIPAAP